ncbi:MAG TPA: hypothetical protein VFY20_05940 [Gemmatimonadales bacterium]|nr:hypothetical protein [Gemmatimonadales bacterium]
MTRRLTWLATAALVACVGHLEAQATVPAGTVLPVTLDEAVSLELKDAGKSYRARIARDVTLAGGTVIPAGTPARVTTKKPAGKPKTAQALLAEVTVNGKAYPVPSQPARIEGSAAASNQAKAAGAIGVTVKGNSTAGPTYVAVSPTTKRLAAGAKLGFALARTLALQ